LVGISSASPAPVVDNSVPARHLCADPAEFHPARVIERGALFGLFRTTEGPRAWSDDFALDHFMASVCPVI
jgi:hypothetical protein